MTPKELAQQSEELRHALEKGEITSEEFAELVNTLIVAESIESQALQLEENLYYRQVIMNVVNIASMISGNLPKT